MTSDSWDDFARSYMVLLAVQHGGALPLTITGGVIKLEAKACPTLTVSLRSIDHRCHFRTGMYRLKRDFWMFILKYAKDFICESLAN